MAQEQRFSCVWCDPQLGSLFRAFFFLLLLMRQVCPGLVPHRQEDKSSPHVAQLCVLTFKISSFFIYFFPKLNNFLLFTAHGVFICLNNHTRLGFLSHCSVKSHLFACFPGLWPESASAARHTRAWCHQAGGNPPSRRETSPPRAPVSFEVSSTPSWRHWRFHQRGKSTSLDATSEAAVAPLNPISRKASKWKIQCSHKA